MKKIALIITLCILYAGNIAAQSTIIDYLTKSRWEIPTPSGQSFRTLIEFSTTEMADIFIYDGTTDKRSTPYYLSDKIDASFDNDKVGKHENGRYIISKKLKSGEIFWFEIVEVNDQRLILKRHSGTLLELNAIKKE